MTRTVTKRVVALENAVGAGRVTVYLPEYVEDEAKAVEMALSGSGFDPTATQVVSVWRDGSIDEPFVTPFMTHEDRLKLLR